MSDIPDMAAIDWDDLHQRLATVQTVLERDMTPSPEAAHAILQARAEALAQVSHEPDATDVSIEVVEFLLAHETYGIETSAVREVTPLLALTPLPCTPRYVLGLINVRGQILSVIDLRIFFELPIKGLTDLNKVIILQAGAVTLGILADAILSVRRVSLRGLQASLPTLTGVREACLTGITGEGLVILNAAKLLIADNMPVHETA